MVIHPIFDTSSVIKYRTEIKKYFETLYFPSMVFFELVATSINRDELKLYSDWRRDLNAEKRILSPTENDIWETAKAIRRLYVNKSTANETHNPANGRAHRPTFHQTKRFFHRYRRHWRFSDNQTRNDRFAGDFSGWIFRLMSLFIFKKNPFSSATGQRDFEKV